MWQLQRNTSHRIIKTDSRVNYRDGVPTAQEFRQLRFSGCGIPVSKQIAQRRIVGGDDAGFGSFPWQVRHDDRAKYLCLYLLLNLFLLRLTGLYTNRIQQMRRHSGQSISCRHRWTLCCKVSCFFFIFKKLYAIIN